MIDLRNCKPGDKLRIRLTGSLKESWDRIHNYSPAPHDIVTYVGPLEESNYYDHEILYSNGSGGTRCHDGTTFRQSKRIDDPDVIEIL